MNSFVRYVLNHGGSESKILYSPAILKGKWSASNTCCVWFNNELIINSRLIEYFKIFQSGNVRLSLIDNMAQSYFFMEGGFESRNIMSVCNGNSIYYSKELPTLPNREFNAFYRGLEDCRLVVWDNKLYAYGTRWDRFDGLGCICVYEVDADMNLVNEIVVKPQNANNCEKNWAAVEDKPFTFVYLNNPMTIVQINEHGDCWLVDKKEKNEDIKEFVKGSTPIVRYDENTYISMVHMNKHYSNDGINYFDYLTAFVLYDNDLNIIKMSDWFVFKSPMCEFACGLTIHGDDVYITYSELDCAPYLLKTSKWVLDGFINNLKHKSDLYHPLEFYIEANVYEENGQTLTSSVLYNYIALISGHNDSLKLECLIKTFSNIVKYAHKFNTQKYKIDVKNCLEKLASEYPECCEFYYLTAYMYKILDDRSEAHKWKELGDEHKLNIHPYFFNYFNPNYL